MIDISEETKFLLTLIVVVGSLLGLLTIAALRILRGSRAGPRTASRAKEGTAEADTSSAESGDTEEVDSAASRLAQISGFVVALSAVGVASDYYARQLVLEYPDLPQDTGLKLRAAVVLIALFAAFLPAATPRLRSLVIGTLLGVLLTAALSIALVVGVARPDVAFPVIVLNAVIASVACFSAALLALLVATVVRMVVDGPRPLNPTTRRLVPWVAAAAIAVAGVLYFTPLLKPHMPAPDPDYRLQPSTWRGEMAYGRAYPFTLVIETVESNGQFVGYMDWGPEYRMKIEGKASGNHLVFEDTAFLRGSAETGIYDRKDVWVEDGQMNGTDKNGRARLSASLVRE